MFQTPLSLSFSFFQILEVFLKFLFPFDTLSIQFLQFFLQLLLFFLFSLSFLSQHFQLGLGIHQLSLLGLVSFVFSADVQGFLQFLIELNNLVSAGFDFFPQLGDSLSQTIVSCFLVGVFTQQETNVGV